ncbi:hypothetical protein FACS1894206_09100 [Deltaproteobacteria bacterium]|nr:hypothetical protein FACS1894206_09100 [Deltaproteobacteria bacterium]
MWENCLFLQHKVAGVALLFLETESSLRYSKHDLPEDMATLALSYHVHLPLDLPWEEGGAKVAAICLALAEKTAFIRPAAFVLHPPDAALFDRAGLTELADFAHSWQNAGQNPGDVLLENTRENDLTNLAGCAFTLSGSGFGLCLDLGHILAYKQNRLVRALPMLPQPRMAHLSSPEVKRGEITKDAHLPLDTLTERGARLARLLCASLADGGIIVAECFVWEYVARSLPVINFWLTRM